MCNLLCGFTVQIAMFEARESLWQAYYNITRYPGHAVAP